MGKPLIYLPTKNACSAYGLPRVPTKINEVAPNNEKIKNIVSSDGTFDFITGIQFQEKRKPIYKNEEARGNKPEEPSISYLKESSWIFDELARRTSSEFTSDATDANAYDANNADLKISSNEIIVEVLTNKPYIVENVKGADGMVRSVYKTNSDDNSGTSSNGTLSGPEKSLAVYRILPEGDNFLKFKHEHEWGKRDGIIKKVIDTGTDMAKKFQRAADMVDAAEGDLVPERQYKNDVRDTYVGSEKPKLSFKFSLFTKNDFINDIYLPILSLCYYAAPSRSGDFEKNHREDMNAALENEIKNIQDSERPNSEKKELLEKLEKHQQEVETNQINELQRKTPGQSLLITDPPPFFRVWHSSGLFFYPRMALINVNYTFHKPFYNLIGNGDINEPQGRIPGYFQMLGESRKFMETSFPLHAEVSLSFEGIDPLFYDDFVSLMSNLGKDEADDIIRIGGV